MRYKNGKGVEDINITVDNGEVKGLLGPNGAGKSTTMRSLMGFLIPSQGTLSVEGINTIENPVEAKKIIGYLPGDPQLPQNLNSKSFARVMFLNISLKLPAIVISLIGLVISPDSTINPFAPTE